jgi:ankyrin repeat protein
MKANILSNLLFSLLIIVAACNTSGEKNVENQEPVKAPAMDIHTATVIGDLEVIRQHVEAGTDLDEREPTMHSTPLISAAVFGKTEVARALIEAGADVNIKNDEGSTALHTAAFLCRKEIVELLLSNGAQKEVLNVYGSTPLASVAGPFEAVKPIYDEFSKNLGPLGFKLDYDQIRATRPVIAAMLQ